MIWPTTNNNNTNKCFSFVQISCSQSRGFQFGWTPIFVQSKWRRNHHVLIVFTIVGLLAGWHPIEWDIRVLSKAASGQKWQGNRANCDVTTQSNQRRCYQLSKMVCTPRRRNYHRLQNLSITLSDTKIIIIFSPFLCQPFTKDNWSMK